MIFLLLNIILYSLILSFWLKILFNTCVGFFVVLFFLILLIIAVIMADK